MAYRVTDGFGHEPQAVHVNSPAAISDKGDVKTTMTMSNVSSSLYVLRKFVILETL